MFLSSKVRQVRRADNLPPCVSRLSRQCGIFNISQPYRPPRPVRGIALLFFLLFIIIIIIIIIIITVVALLTVPQGSV
jgi:hypothetical protein